MVASRTEFTIAFDDLPCVQVALVLEHLGDPKPDVLLRIHSHEDGHVAHGVDIITPPAVMQAIAHAIIESLKKVDMYDPLMKVSLPDPPKDVQAN